MFVINLDNRTDRLIAFENAFANLNIKRISAIDGNHLVGDLHFVDSNVAACWLSHLKTYTEFLKLEDSHCLIFEDDAVPLRNFYVTLQNIIDSDLTPIDFLQLGFSTYRKRLDDGQPYPLQMLIDLVKIKARTYTKKDVKTLNNEAKLVKRLQIKNGDIQSGTHCYLISRRMAEGMLKFNNPVFMAADLAFMSIETQNPYSVFRMIRSKAKQSNSQSSIRKM